jgi:large subunit ribosomal protein L27e
VVLLLSGRHAGKKALVVRSYDEGNKARKFANALVVGVARQPRNVHRRTSKKQFLKRTTVKPFVKYVNFNHLMPTRYVVGDFDLKDLKDIKD